MADLHPSKYTKPHAWMDPDFLETLFPVTMNFTHSRTEFTFWTVRIPFLIFSYCALPLSSSSSSSSSSPPLSPFSYGVLHYLFQPMFVIYPKKRNPF
jgi:hypothetical protein